MMLASCSKEEILVVNDYDNERLIIDGFLTSDLETQSFKVSLANNIGDSSIYPMTDISATISGNSLSYDFELVDSNYMQSLIPFQAIPGLVYTIDYCYKGICGSKDFLIPAAITAESAYYAQIPVSNNILSLDIDLTLSSNVDQWCRLEVYQLDSVLAGDSMWSHLPHPVYDVFEVRNSSSEHYIIEEVIPDFGIGLSSSTFKIFCYSLSSETGEYLSSLDVFMNGEFTGSQYQNPPNYFDDGTLGLYYGTVVDSVYLQY